MNQIHKIELLGLVLCMFMGPRSKQPSPSPAQYSCASVKSEGIWSMNTMR